MAEFTPAVREQFDVDWEGPARLIYEWMVRTRPIPGTKQAMVQALRELYGALPPPEAPQWRYPAALMTDVRREEIHTPGFGDAPPVRSLVYHPPPMDRAPPVLVYFHGGGWSIGDPEEADLLTRKICLLGE